MSPAGPSVRLSVMPQSPAAPPSPATRRPSSNPRSPTCSGGVASAQTTSPTVASSPPAIASAGPAPSGSVCSTSSRCSVRRSSCRSSPASRRRPRCCFSGVGTILFLLVTRNRLPSYLGSSFAIIAPVTAASASHGQSSALGGLVVVGALLIVIGLIVHLAGTGWIEALMPPIVTGTIVAIIGLNLAPTAKTNFTKDAVTATIVLVLLVAVLIFFRGLFGRLAIVASVIVGYLIALARGKVETDAIGAASWVGLPDFTAPSFHLSVLPLFIPVVLVLVVENIGHVRSITTMTGVDHDRQIGRALAADGLATVIAGSGGGSATTTYAENIGVMAATRVYSTAAYWVAGVGAVLLGLSPKVGAVIASIPRACSAASPPRSTGSSQCWASTSGCRPRRLHPADQPVHRGHPARHRHRRLRLEGRRPRFRRDRLGSVAALVIYHAMRVIGGWRGTVVEPTRETVKR